MQVSYRVLLISCVVLMVCVAATRAEGKRLDCQSFCTKTGFTGNIGGCQCGYTIFGSKRGTTGTGLFRELHARFRLRDLLKKNLEQQ
ncbi:uncharacterized protein LOC143231462 [Tachypleus tridentatus]|uniref:uncharacterized protein LOC143231462 n=1 Tax=Tachypleus tridentatus TaxID=6853 RepID=UPI003FD2B5AC